MSRARRSPRKPAGCTPGLPHGLTHRQDRRLPSAHQLTYLKRRRKGMNSNVNPGATRADPAVKGGRPDDQTPTSDERRDRIRWGPVWAGALTTLSTYVVLQLLFFALGWLDLGFDGGGDSTVRAVVSGVLGLVAFFLGGAAAGASSLWHRANDGMVNG